ncbi:MAG: hypothetical protein LH624_08520, partial [Cryobacterium sp.]|nr:hypothetical protein [Cryobacterium sp.]
MKRIIGSLVGAVLLVAVAAASPAAAEGRVSPDARGAGQSATVLPGESETMLLADGETSMTIELDEAQIVTQSMISGDKGLTVTQKAELINATTSSAVRTNTWSQFTTGGAYTNTQNGRFYYNGTRVWVTQSYLGYNGNHA